MQNDKQPDFYDENGEPCWFASFGETVKLVAGILFGWAALAGVFFLGYVIGRIFKGG
jgi:hypothetical protein